MRSGRSAVKRVDGIYNKRNVVIRQARVHRECQQPREYSFSRWEVAPISVASVHVNWFVVHASRNASLLEVHGQSVAKIAGH